MAIRRKRWQRVFCCSLSLLFLIGCLFIPASAAEDDFPDFVLNVPEGISDDVLNTYVEFLSEFSDFEVFLPSYFYLSDDLFASQSSEFPVDGFSFDSLGFDSLSYSELISSSVPRDMAIDYFSVEDPEYIPSSDEDFSSLYSFYLVSYSPTCTVDGVTYSLDSLDCPYSFENSGILDDFLLYLLIFYCPGYFADGDFFSFLQLYLSDLLDYEFYSDCCLFAIRSGLEFFAFNNFSCVTDTGEDALVSFNAKCYQVGFSSDGNSPFGDSSSGTTDDHSGILGSVLLCFSQVGSFILSLMVSLGALFYVSGSGLTVIGILAVAGLAFSVAFLIIRLIFHFLHFRN